MTRVRAKFQCMSVERFTAGTDGPCTYRFSPQYDDSIPEDRRFTRYTPSGELRMTVDNPNVQFEPGEQYYLDFTPAAEQPDLVELARAVYDAYGETTDHLNHRGEPMPAWEDLGDRIQDAWRAAARVAAGG